MSGTDFERWWSHSIRRLDREEPHETARRLRRKLARIRRDDRPEFIGRLPVSVAGALMPDAHTGYGLPIGGVLATDTETATFTIPPEHDLGQAGFTKLVRHALDRGIGWRQSQCLAIEHRIGRARDKRRQDRRPGPE